MASPTPAGAAPRDEARAYLWRHESGRPGVTTSEYPHWGKPGEWTYVGPLVLAAAPRADPGDEVKTLRTMVMRYAENRCPICSWPLHGDDEAGCTPGNCAFRPTDASPEREAILPYWYALTKMYAAARAPGGAE